jgi:vacuolar-type H+-ATPase catalytic subunit A/Vma1
VLQPCQRNLLEHVMRDEKQYWTINWTQLYNNWNQSVPQEPEENEITDFSEAREVLARIMSL